jgi:hypothetical protein
MTLTGSGAITLSDDQNNTIHANYAGDTLVNLNNTISGAGNIGNGGSLTLINDGTINATGTNALVINTASPITNAGLMEATGGGGLTLQSAVDNAATGTITAATGSSGGVLSFLGSVVNAGTIEAASGLASISQAVTGAGTLAIGATGTLSLLEGASAGQTADFLATSGTLDSATPFLGTIAGFGGSDLIDLTNIAGNSWNFANDVLSITETSTLNGSITTTTLTSLTFAGTYTSADFAVGSDLHGGTSITYL